MPILKINKNKNNNTNEIEYFLQKHPENIFLIKEEFLSDDLKAKLNPKNSNKFQMNLPFDEDNLTKVASCSKKRLRESSDLNNNTIKQNNEIDPEILDTTIELDSEDESYQFTGKKQNKRANLLETTKSIENLDLTTE